MSKSYNLFKIQKLATEFWDDSLLDIQFPIALSVLEQAILLNYPISLVKLNKLSLTAITAYLRSRNINIETVNDTKELYGFIISQGNYTYIFLNGTEPAKEQSFTLAHEFAHYLFDYLIPRQSLIDIFGTSICDALDNKRAFNTEERVAALIKGYSLKPFTHLLDIPIVSAIQRQSIWRAEASADQLALEILAPYRNIIRDIQSSRIQKNYTALIEFIGPNLENRYGLPSNIAKWYGKELANRISGGMSLREKWKV